MEASASFPKTVQAQTAFDVLLLVPEQRGLYTLFNRRVTRIIRYHDLNTSRQSRHCSIFERK